MFNVPVYSNFTVLEVGMDKEGEIDYLQPNIIYLTNVNAVIKLKDSTKIKIKSNYGKYNSDNFDTIFKIQA